MSNQEIKLELIFEDNFLADGLRLEYPPGTTLTLVGSNIVYDLLNHLKIHGIKKADVEIFVRIHDSA